VENIIYTDKSRMPNGVYQIVVNNYSNRGLHTLFNIEIEIEGEVNLLRLKRKTGSNSISVGVIQLKENKFLFTPSEEMDILESISISKEIYGIQTNEFHKVNLVCLSPNHWGNSNIGNKHYFFMIDGCKSPTDIRSFHNENLLPELAQHRKVLEVLGATNMISSSEKQLSGIGFNATVRDELIVKLQGSHKRIIKIKF
jgi:hypothetical protein